MELSPQAHLKLCPYWQYLIEADRITFDVVRGAELYGAGETQPAQELREKLAATAIEECESLARCNQNGGLRMRRPFSLDGLIHYLFRTYPLRCGDPRHASGRSVMDKATLEKIISTLDE